MIWQISDGLFPLMTHRTIPAFNINGLCCDARQQMLRNFICRNDLDIIFSKEMVNNEFRQMPLYQFRYDTVAKAEELQLWRGTPSRSQHWTTPDWDSNCRIIPPCSASKYIWPIWKYGTARSRTLLCGPSLNVRNIPQYCILEGPQLRVTYSWLQKQP